MEVDFRSSAAYETARSYDMRRRRHGGLLVVLVAASQHEEGCEQQCGGDIVEDRYPGKLEPRTGLPPRVR